MLTSLFLPAVTLMNRLKYPQKFAVISLVFALPLALVMYLLVSQINIGINFAQKERSGVEYIRPLRDLLERVQLHQLLAMQYLNGDLALKEKLIHEQIQVDSVVHEVDVADQKLGAELRTTERWNALKGMWWEMKGKAFGFDRLQSFEEHNRLIESILSLIAHAGDTSNLILDPDLDTYYLMDNAVTKLPGMIDRLGRARGSGVDVAGRQMLSSDDRILLVTLSGQLESLLEAIRRGMQVAFGYNPALKPKIESGVQRNVSSISGFLETVNSKMLRAEKISIQPAGYLAAGTETLDSCYRLYDATLVELDSLLQKRITGFVLRRSRITAFVAFVLILVMYLFAAFYRAVMRTVSSLEEASHRMVSGDMGGVLAIETRDELGQVVKSFNSIVTRLRTEWAQAREESARATAAEAMLRESEARTRSVIESALDAVIVMDAGGIITEWNPQAEIIFGWYRQEAVGRRMMDLIVPPQQLEYRSGLQRFLEPGEGPVLNRRIEISALNRAGQEFPVEISIIEGKGEA